MASSEAFDAFDIVLVPFPFSDRMAEKRRPALIVSKPELATQHGHLWLAMITSAKQLPWTSDVPIHDLVLAGLPAASVVRTAKIATIETSRILKKLGRLDTVTAAAARQQVITQLG